MIAFLFIWLQNQPVEIFLHFISLYLSRKKKGFTQQSDTDCGNFLKDYSHYSFHPSFLQVLQASGQGLQHMCQNRLLLHTTGLIETGKKAGGGAGESQERSRAESARRERKGEGTRKRKRTGTGERERGWESCCKFWFNVLDTICIW